MTREETKNTEHFAYPLPFNDELYELQLIPYRTNTHLKIKIDYIFRHVTFEHRELFIEVSTSGSRELLSDMSRVALGCTRYFILNPQQFAYKMENIHMQILVKMWKQTFKHCKMQYKELDKYYATKMKLLMIENGLIEELIRTADEKDYIQTNDDMVKRRVNKYTNKELPLRERVYYGGNVTTKELEYLCSLE